jgi:hypothetical protein
VSVVTSDEVWALITTLALRVAELESVDVTGERTVVVERTRRALAQPQSHKICVTCVPVFAATDQHVVQLELVRVTEPVNSDDSLITSQSVPVNQTDDQVDQANEEK